MNRSGLSSNPFFVSFCLLLCLDYCTSRPAAEQALHYSTLAPADTVATPAPDTAVAIKPGQLWCYAYRPDTANPFQDTISCQSLYRIKAVKKGYVQYMVLTPEGKDVAVFSSRIRTFLIDTHLVKENSLTATTHAKAAH